MQERHPIVPILFPGRIGPRNHGGGSASLHHLSFFILLSHILLRDEEKREGREGSTVRAFLHDSEIP